MSTRITIHIQNLVLEGFRDIDAGVVGAALETELRRLFTETGTPAALSAALSASLSGAATMENTTEITSHTANGSFRLKPGADGGTVGVGAARTLYGILGRQRSK